MRRLIFAILLFPLPALAQQAPTPTQPTALQRGTEWIVLELTREWQRSATEAEQMKDALRDAQANAMAKMKENNEKEAQISKLNAKVTDLETLTSQLQSRLKLEGKSAPVTH